MSIYPFHVKNFALLYFMSIIYFLQMISGVLLLITDVTAFVSKINNLAPKLTLLVLLSCLHYAGTYTSCFVLFSNIICAHNNIMPLECMNYILIMGPCCSLGHLFLLKYINFFFLLNVQALNIISIYCLQFSSRNKTLSQINQKFDIGKSKG